MHRVAYLLGFGERHARVAGALRDEERPREARGIAGGRDREQECSHRGVALVAIPANGHPRRSNEQ